MMDTVKDFVSAIGDGDNLSAETHFNNALAAYVGGELETKSQDVAKTFVTQHVPEEEDSE